MMENTMENRALRQRWEDETSERKGSIAEFIKNYFENRKIGKQEGDERIEDYDSFTEFHFSGLNFDVLTKVKKGEVEPEQVNVYYEGKEIKQIHVLYNSEGKGQNLDVYLKERALEDYLRDIETETKED